MKILFSQVFILLLLGCHSTPLNDFRDRFAIANAVLGDQFEIYYVPSNGTIADNAYIKLSSPQDPSADARRLAHLMAEGESKATRLAASSPANKKMAAIITQAAYLNQNKTLSHLQLLYIGSKNHEPNLRAAIERLGATFYFERY